MSGGIAVITGESFGIADLLARRGYDLNLVARLAIHAGGSVRQQSRHHRSRSVSEICYSRVAPKPSSALRFDDPPRTGEQACQDPGA